MVFSWDFISALSDKAKTSERLRINYNVHHSFIDNVQRMFHAIEPESVFPISRHPDAAETLIAIRGKLLITIYTEKKDVLESIVIGPQSKNIGYHIPKGIWHQVKSLETGTVVFETREGPYCHLAEEDKLK